MDLERNVLLASAALTTLLPCGRHTWALYNDTLRALLECLYAPSNFLPPVRSVMLLYRPTYLTPL